MKKILLTSSLLISTLFAQDFSNVSMNKETMIKQLKGITKTNPYIKDANYTLGIYYMAGDAEKGIKPDFTLAMKHLLKDKDNLAIANFKIAELHYKGLGVPRNYRKAIRWFKRATNIKFKDASIVSSRAKLSIGEAYMMKLKEYENAFPYFLEVAQSKQEPAAEMTVAFMYLHGKGVEKNLEDANYWINKAYFNPRLEAAQKVYMSNFLESSNGYSIEADIKEVCNEN